MFLLHLFEDWDLSPGSCGTMKVQHQEFLDGVLWLWASIHGHVSECQVQPSQSLGCSFIQEYPGWSERYQSVTKVGSPCQAQVSLSGVRGYDCDGVVSGCFCLLQTITNQWLFLETLFHWILIDMYQIINPKGILLQNSNLRFYWSIKVFSNI